MYLDQSKRVLSGERAALRAALDAISVSFPCHPFLLLFLAHLLTIRFGEAQLGATVGVGRTHFAVGETDLTLFASATGRTATHLTGTTITGIQAFDIGGNARQT